MKKNIKLYVSIGLIIIIVFAIIIVSIIKNINSLSTGEGEEEVIENEYPSGGAEYNPEQLNNLDINVTDIPQEIKEKVNEKDLITSIKEYMFKNGLVDATIAKYDNHRIDETQKQIKVRFILNNDDNNVLYVIINLNTNEIKITEDNNNSVYITDKSFYTLIYCVENYIKQDYQFIPLNIKLNKGLTVDKYLVYGYFVDNNYNLIEKMYLYVSFDNINKTFSIEKPKNQDINLDKIEIENEEQQIENNINNSLETIYIDDDYIVRKCFNNFKVNLILNYGYIYDNLDEEYKKAKFSDVNTFKEYILNNTEKYKNMGLIKYSKDKDKNGKTKYTFCNSYGDYYTLINVQNNVKYEIFLDNYTIMSDEDIDKYKKASNKNKVYTNIQNFIYMINNKDYESAYKVLDEDFKDVNNLTMQNFKEYITNKLFDYNYISSSSNFAESEDGQYIMTLIVKNKIAVAADQKEIRFVVILGEDTNFKIAILD